MFIGHLPGAYLAFKAAAPRLPPPAFAAGMLASVLPDIDLFWFYVVDRGAVHHHEYLTHRPILWAGFALLGLLFLRWRRLGLALVSFGLGGLIHMALDTIAGAINWLWPIGTLGGPLVVVPATHDHWVASFVTHWTFLNEIAICVLAALVFLRSRRARK